LAVLHLLEFDQGSVHIDDINVSDITRQQLRSRITVIPQESINLPGSVRDNLCLGLQDTNSAVINIPQDADIENVLLKVGLWEHICANHGLGDDMLILPLSQGQRQLFCLARALLHHEATQSRIVLIDEATSSVDTETDSRMQAVLKDSFADCTLVVVAHKLETLQGVDVTVELRDGTIVDRTDRV
jgi:ATP-binding cassette, subfamily C (CFTR/MRP), member 1